MHNTITQLLNKEQLEAVRHKDGPLLILAGAGSGKTRVITYRIAFLISEYKVNPENILAVTFTNKAADEMKARIKKVVGKDAERIWMSTFHSMGCRILRHHAEKLGWSRNFSIYDEDDRERLVKHCMNELGISEKQIKSYSIIRSIQDIKNSLLSPEQYEIKNMSTYEIEMALRVYKIYEEKLFRNNAMDFDDLIVKTIELFEKNPEILQIYQEKFKYILIDEYQDINNSQYVLISMLAKRYKNICVVGDDDQSIYGFRGADITNILDFEEDYPDAKVVRLEQNYRSTKKILKAAHSVIKNNFGRKDKELWTENTDGENIIFYYANDEEDEANYVANKILELIHTENVNLKDIAVFYRMNAQSRNIEDKLRRAGIPYRLVGGIQFYARMEIKDLLAYLRLISNPYDIVSFKRIINVPPRGIGDAALDKLEKYSFENNISIYETLFKVDEIEDIKEYQKNAIKKFGEFIKKLNEEKDKIKLQELLKKIISETGYKEYWENDNSQNAKERVENIKELVSAIAEYEENNQGKTLDDFLSQVSLISEIDRWDKEANAVTLMTIHSAKGLEFDIVFVIGMQEEIFPHKNSLLENAEEGIEEERRLCYVSITRAKKKLFLTGARVRRQYGQKKICSLSRFLNEMPKDLIKFEGGMPPEITKKIYEYEKEESCNDIEYIDAEYDDNTLYQYKKGQKVKHSKMGTGIIQKVEPYGEDIRITVLFKNKGKKVLSAKYAKLDVIE